METNKKQYLTPMAEITEFECEDVITASMLKTSIESIGSPVQTYKYTSSADWNKVYGSGSN